MMLQMILFDFNSPIETKQLLLSKSMFKWNANGNKKKIQTTTTKKHWQFTLLVRIYEFRCWMKLGCGSLLEFRNSIEKPSDYHKEQT